jgi:hypothetical protein
MQPIENSMGILQNLSKSIKFHPKIRTRLELSNFGGWRAASPTAFIRILGHKTGLQPVLIHPTANLGDRTKMYVLFLNNHCKLCFSYFIAPADVIDTARKVHDFLTVGAAAPLMEAAVAGLTMPDSYYVELKNLYTRKRNLMLNGLDALKIPHTVPEGAYYILLDIGEFGYDDDLRFCEELAEKVGVGAVPGSSFFREPVRHLIRLHFAKQESTLEEALNRLEHLREKMR